MSSSDPPIPSTESQSHSSNPIQDINPPDVRSSVAEEARDLEYRPDSYTSIPQYYPRKNSNSGAVDGSDSSPSKADQPGNTVSGSGTITSSPSPKSKPSFSSPSSASSPTRKRTSSRAQHGFFSHHNNKHKDSIDASNSSLSPGQLESASATERTPLLDPSDPLVSPLNLSAVRSLRNTLWVLLGFSIVFTIFLFINTFISFYVPLLNTSFFRLLPTSILSGLVSITPKDSGFPELILVFLADISLLLSLFFFTFPTSTDRLLGIVAASALFLSLLLTSFIPGLRQRYNGASLPLAIGWYFLSATLGLIVSPTIVLWGKTHEEVRLTGRRETRRTVREWLAVSLSVIVSGIFVVLPSLLFFADSCLNVYDYARLHKEMGTGLFVPIYPNPLSTSTPSSSSSLWSESQYTQNNNDPVHLALEPIGKGEDSGYHKPWKPLLVENPYHVFVYCTPRQKSGGGVGGGNGNKGSGNGGNGGGGIARPPSSQPGPDGKPAPIVLVEADSYPAISAQAFVEGWLDELFNANKIAQICYWNRPGRGFSGEAPSPFSPGMAADALTVALSKALRETGDLDDGNNDDDDNDTNGSDKWNNNSTHAFGNNSFAIVAHGLGGIYARVFAARHLPNVHSITLVDAFPEELLSTRVGRIPHGFGVWMKAAWSVLGIDRQLSWIVHRRGPRSRELGLLAGSNTKELKASLQEQMSACVGLFGFDDYFNDNNHIDDFTTTNSIVVDTNKIPKINIHPKYTSTPHSQMRRDIEASNLVLEGSIIPLAVLSSASHVRSDKEWSNYQRKLTKVTSNNVAWEVLEGPHELWRSPAAKTKMQQILVNILEQRQS